MKNLKIIFILFFICILSCIPTYGNTTNSSIILNGIDVSNWQGYIDYEKVKNSGIDVVYIESSIGAIILRKLIFLFILPLYLKKGVPLRHSLYISE